MKKIKSLIPILLTLTLLCAAVPLCGYADVSKPTASEVVALFENSEYNGVHPRILADSADFDYFRSEFGTGSMVDAWIEDIVAEADELINLSPVGYRIQDNLRLTAVAQKAVSRISCLGFAYQVTQNAKYADRAWKEMKAIAEFDDWNPGHFLDTAELSFAMSLGYDWCYGYLSGVDGALLKVETAVIEKGIKEGKKQYDGDGEGTNFTTLNNNWAIVCNSSLITAALAMIEKAESLCTEIIENALADLPDALAEYAPDGGWEESVGYGEYATEYLCRMADSAKRVLGSDFGVMNTEGLDKYALSRIYMDGSVADFNYHDDAESRTMSHVVMWLGKYYNNTEITSHYLYVMDKYNLDGDVWTCLAYDRVSAPKVGDFQLDTVTQNVEAGTMRSSYEGTEGAYLAYHGGKKAGVSHYHYDVGSFVYDMMGVRWASDLGSEPLTYSVGGDPSLYYRTRAEGHNTLVIGADQSPGQLLYGCDAKIKSSKSSETEAFQILDMTSAYTNTAAPSDTVTSVQRGYKLCDNRRTLVLRDEITLKKDSEIYWFMHTGADIEIDSSNESAILTIGNKKMKMDWYCEPWGIGELSVMEAVPLAGTSPNPESQASNAGYKKLAIKLNGTAESPVSISVRLTPAEEEFADTFFVCDELSEWSVTTGTNNYKAPSYQQMFIGHELFDAEIPSGKSSWSKKYNEAQILAMRQSTSTAIKNAYGLGNKEETDGCIALVTSDFSATSGNDPFFNIAANTAQKGTFTIEFDFFADTTDADIIAQLRAGTMIEAFKVTADGLVVAGGNVTGARLEKGVWHELAVTTHTSTATSDVYLDGRRIASGIASSSSVSGIKLLALYPSDGAKSYSGTLAIDNVRMYTGEQEQYFTVYFDADGNETSSISDASEIYFNLANRRKTQSFMAVYSVDENGVKTLTGITNLGQCGEGKHLFDKNSVAKIIFVENTVSLTPTIEAIEIK